MYLLLFTHHLCDHFAITRDCCDALGVFRLLTRISVLLCLVRAFCRTYCRWFCHRRSCIRADPPSRLCISRYARSRHWDIVFETKTLASHILPINCIILHCFRAYLNFTMSLDDFLLLLSSIRTHSCIILCSPHPGGSSEHSALVRPRRHRPRVCQLLEGSLCCVGRRSLCVGNNGHSRRSRLARHCTNAHLFFCLFLLHFCVYLCLVCAIP
jgi:hypothetical protein